jgi:phosphoglycolate phosphatase
LIIAQRKVDQQKAGKVAKERTAGYASKRMGILRLREKALLFDLDGTLVDSKQDLVAAANAARASVGLPSLSNEAVQANVGLGVDSLIRSILGTEDQGLFRQAKEAFISYYTEHLLDHTRIFEGLEPILKTLQRSQVGVVTNKARVFALPLLEGLGISDRFGAIVTPEDAGQKKPDPEPLLYALRLLGLPPERAVVVGDSRYDIEAGRRAGLQTVAVLWGFGTPEEIERANPDIIVRSPNDLAKLLSTS